MWTPTRPRPRSRTAVLPRALAALALLAAAPAAQIYVDDDAPSDPYPNDPTQSGFEDGSAAYPFDSLSEALAASGSLVVLRPGTYSGSENRDLKLSGAIVGERGADETILDLELAGALGHVPSYCELTGLTVRNALAPSGAVEVLAGAELYVRHSVFQSNLAFGAGARGGAITACGLLRLWNSAFHRNASAGSGGAVAICCDSEQLSTHLIEHCTFRGNYALGSGGALYFAGVDATLGASRVVYASILAENAAGAGGQDVGEENPGYVAVFDSIVQAPWAGPGTGSFVADPVFADPLDWHIGYGSPADDAALGSTICLVDTQDVDDQTRDCLVSDIGADELRMVTHVVPSLQPGGPTTVRLSGLAPGAPALVTASAALLDPPILVGPPFQELYHLANPLLLPPAAAGPKGSAAWSIALPPIAGVEIYFQGLTATEMEAGYTQVQILP